MIGRWGDWLVVMFAAALCLFLLDLPSPWNVVVIFIMYGVGRWDENEGSRFRERRWS